MDGELLKKMRVISGFLKGRLIKLLKNSNTRPLKDSVKENIFNVLEHSNLIKAKIKNSNVLDLYSGVGSFGIESISRDAAKVVFVEKDIDAFKVLTENLSLLSIKEKSEIFNYKVENFLKENCKKKFNIFFFDPPFKDFKFLTNLLLIKKKQIYEKNHIVVIHREKKTNDNYNNIIRVIDNKFYGRSKIIFGKFV